MSGYSRFAGAACAMVVAPMLLAQTSTETERPIPTNSPGTWISTEDYPPAALDSRAQGAVGYTLTVDSAGKVTDCKIVSSSGSAALDDRTCSLLRDRARFNVATAEPARFYSSHIRWALPAQMAAEQQMPPIEVSSTVSRGLRAAQLTIGSDGLVNECSPFDRPYKNVDAPADLCASFPVGSRCSAPTMHSGKPVRRRIRIQIATETSMLSGN